MNPVIQLIDSRHKVYILQSIVNPKKTYVGYSVDINRRLRQHNGELVGGAKSTKSGRPYKIVCYISGFPDNTSALQFEWRCHHPSGRPRKRGKGSLKTRFDKLSGIERRIAILEYILKLDKWTNNAIDSKLFSLTVNWLEPGHQLRKCPYPHEEVTISYTSNFITIE